MEISVMSILSQPAVKFEAGGLQDDYFSLQDDCFPLHDPRYPQIPVSQTVDIVQCGAIAACVH